MRAPYRKGRATHPEPESCAGDGNTAGEALTGAPAGHRVFGGPDSRNDRRPGECLADHPAVNRSGDQGDGRDPHYRVVTVAKAAALDDHDIPPAVQAKLTKQEPLDTLLRWPPGL
jgi:hypothetical protein